MEKRIAGIVANESVAWSLFGPNVYIRAPRAHFTISFYVRASGITRYRVSKDEDGAFAK